MIAFLPPDSAHLAVRDLLARFTSPFPSGGQWEGAVSTQQRQTTSSSDGSMMEQINAPRVVTAPSMNEHAPIAKRNGPRTMIHLTWLGWEALVEYTTLDGREVLTSATLLDWCGLGIIRTIAGARSIVAWDALRTVELRGD
jgi:hypothetical protein